MPSRKVHSPIKRRSPDTKPAAKARSRAVLVIDNLPLQRAAWAEYRAAQKRHDQSARDLHRHEQVDVPAYEAWLHRTFPVLITTLRELHEEVSSKTRQIQHVQAMAALSGRPAKKLWREQKEAEANPDLFDDPFEDFGTEEPRDRERRQSHADDFFNDAHGFREDRASGPDFEFERPSENFANSREAKAIYRRLVQHLHPDRGGDFNAVRKRLWHEVQQAWATRDADWLSRIEVEWETANEVLSLHSPLSRLRRAIEELNAARRDTQRKLREYRKSFPWRFSLAEKKRNELHRRAEASFKHDIDFLSRQLAHLKAIIAVWESKTRPTRRHRYSTWQTLY
jgi:hypothetical protein